MRSIARVTSQTLQMKDPLVDHNVRNGLPRCGSGAPSRARAVERTAWGMGVESVVRPCRRKLRRWPRKWCHAGGDFGGGFERWRPRRAQTSAAGLKAAATRCATRRLA